MRWCRFSVKDAVAVSQMFTLCGLLVSKMGLLLSEKCCCITAQRCISSWFEMESLFTEENATCKVIQYFDLVSNPDSKHWFTTSFLQPLPCLVRP